jgi:hypothetical protein
MADWLEVDDTEIHTALVPMIRAIEAERRPYLDDLKRWAALYRDRPIVDFWPGSWRNEIGWQLDVPLSYNIIRSCVDTLQSKLAIHQPIPKFMTSNALQETQDDARQMERFTIGLLNARDGWRVAARALRDALLYGTGIVKIYSRDKRVVIEQVHVSRIIVDEQACLNGVCHEMHQHEMVSLDDMKAMWPDADLSGSNPLSAGVYGQWVRDMIDVFETWRLPSYGKPGKHTICTDGVTLFSEEWKSERFPFAMLRHQDPLLGWYGSGVASIVEGIQVEINTLLDRIRQNMNLLAVPYVLKHVSSSINDEHLLSNDIARMVEWDGNIKPEVVTPPAIHPQVFEQLETLVRRSYEMVGVSQLSAGAQKPAGLSSGVAIRTFHDIETQRFSQLARQWERLFVDIAWLVVDAAKRSKERVRWVGPTGYEEIALSDINLDSDQFEISVLPASGLPQTPAGRLERVVEMAQAGMIDQRESRRLLGMPDLEKADRLANAPLDDIDRTMEHMLRTGEYIAPMPMQDLAYGLRMCASYWLRARMDGEEDKKLDMLARWLSEAADILRPDAPVPTIPNVPLGAGGAPGAPVMAVQPPIPGIPGQ